MIDDKLIGLMYDGVMESRPWSSFLATIRSSMKSISASLTFDLPSGQALRQDIGNSDRQRISLRRDYYSQYHEHNPISYLNMEYGKVYNLMNLTNQDLNSKHMEYCRKAGIDHSLMAYIGEVDGVRVRLNIARSNGDGAYNADDMERICGLIPHLTRAMKIFNTIKRVNISKDFYKDTLDRLCLCVVMLGCDGQIIEMNNYARTVLNHSGPVSISGNRLSIESSWDYQKFVDSLKSVTAEEGGSKFAVMTVGQATSEPLSLVLRRAETANGIVGSGSAVSAILYFKNPDARFLPKMEVVSEMYGLKPTEARVAIAIVGGASIKEAAGTLGMTEETVRTYVKRIFQKTGVQRQSGLVKLIGTGLAVIG